MSVNVFVKISKYCRRIAGAKMEVKLSARENCLGEYVRGRGEMTGFFLDRSWRRGDAVRGGGADTSV